MSNQIKSDVPPTVMEQISTGAERERRLIRWSIGLAVVAHVVFFAIQWPSLVNASAAAPVRPEPPIRVLVNLPPKEPPKRELNIRPPTQRTVFVPDPDPHDPEPIRDESDMAPVPGNTGDVVWAPSVEVPDPPPEVPSGPMVVGGEVTAPIRVGGADPRYPEAARAAHMQGSVILGCVVSRTGAVREVTVLRGAPLGMTEAAIQAVRTWTYEPATHRGNPVDAIYIVTVWFRLS
jgi:TonB family protein